ncbi:MAG: hypothetical protein ACR2F6_08775 [Mycobacteriales bacterium]
MPKPLSRTETAELCASLESVRAAIAAGELTASASTGAMLAGGVTALQAVTGARA